MTDEAKLGMPHFQGGRGGDGEIRVYPLSAEEEHDLNESRSARLYYHVEDLNGSDEPLSTEEYRVPCEKAKANLVGSLCLDGKHRPVLDIDFPARLVPSTTPGHFHLYLEVALEEAEYMELLQALGKARVLSSFYARASRTRKQSFCRPEWVKKEWKREE